MTYQSFWLQCTCLMFTVLLLFENVIVCRQDLTLQNLEPTMNRSDIDAECPCQI